MNDLKELTLVKLKLLKRLTYEKKKKINYFLITIGILIVVFYFSYTSRNIIFNLSSSLLIIGSLYYHSSKDQSFIQFKSLKLLAHHKTNYLFHNLFTEIFTKLLIIIPLLFTGLFDSLNLIIFFFLYNILFVVACYFATEVSKLDRFYYYVFRIVTFSPFLFFIEGFNSIILKRNSFLLDYIYENFETINLTALATLSAIILLFSLVFKRKIYSI
jgi:hypothetical protein